MKRYLCLTLCALLLLSFIPLCTQESAKFWANPFLDISEDDNFYEAVSSLNHMGIVESTERFYPESHETRGGALSYLYALYLKDGGKVTGGKKAFKDVPKGSKYFSAVSWAYKNGIVTKEKNKYFNPYQSITREQIATFLIRYAQKFEIKIPKLREPTQFKDSLDVNQYARTPVAVCKMSGILPGNKNGFLYPAGTVKKNEAVSIIYSFIKAANLRGKSGEWVSTEEGAYDGLYSSYSDTPYTARVEASDAVDLSYFDNCAFVGDSVSFSLKKYCEATGSLGNATFLAAGSMSATNALRPLNSKDSMHPTYKGVKMTVQDGIKECGADKVYIMLGMNGIGLDGYESEVQQTLKLVNKILEKSPGTEILIQSVTPMARGSASSGKKLNNSTIAKYNEKMEEICCDNGWYFINVAEAVTDADGYLKSEYCSDPGGQAIHFTTAGLTLWIDYLKTHVPEILK